MSNSCIHNEGFEPHPDKARVIRKGGRHEVTGLVVNKKAAVPHKILRRFRATLLQIQEDGPAGKKWGADGDVMESIHGFANFVAMEDPE